VSFPEPEGLKVVMEPLKQAISTSNSHPRGKSVIEVTAAIVGVSAAITLMIRFWAVIVAAPWWWGAAALSIAAYFWGRSWTAYKTMVENMMILVLAVTLCVFAWLYYAAGFVWFNYLLFPVAGLAILVSVFSISTLISTLLFNPYARVASAFGHQRPFPERARSLMLKYGAHRLIRIIEASGGHGERVIK